MKIEPNLKDWAEALIFGITGQTSLSDKTLKWVEEELQNIADKYYQMGFEDGDKDGWWKTQEEDLAQLGLQDRKIEGKPWRKFGE